MLKYDIEVNVFPSSPKVEKGYSGTRDLESEELLEQVAPQQLLYRLIGCKDEFKFFKCQQVVLQTADGYTAPYTRRCSLEE
ncbi:hypothetical protein K1719_004126 [Acacia pycnantha]|nr:hypothetical protein K1719_004126 [Acacia pycnantha]